MKKASRFLCLLLTVVLLSTLFSACSTSSETPAKSDTEKTTSSEDKNEAQADKPAAVEKKKVYLLYPALGFPFIAALMEYCNKFANEIGVELTIFDGQMDDNIQYEQAMQAINDKVDLVVLCVMGEGGGTIMRKLKEANIPCVLLNQTPAEENYDYYDSAVIADNVNHGRQCAQMVIDKFGDNPCNIVTIDGMAADSGSVERGQGFEEVISAKSNYKILASQAADWDKGKAINIMEDYIVKYGDEIDVVYCHDDALSAGAIEALKAAGMGGGKKMVVGIGLNREGIANIKSGEQYGSAAHEPADFAKICFEVVDKILKGESVEKITLVPDPAYTKDNINEYPYGDGTW
jgi:ABC-type sugar transport system substrate-binding protein